MATPALAQSAGVEEHNLAELRDTVINLIQALVDRGVITREQAETMIRDAKAKAEAETAALTAKQKAQEDQDKNAVRVPYVPQIVKDQITAQVMGQIQPAVKDEVDSELKKPETVRSVLPDWITRMNWTGDVRMRGEADTFGHGNVLYTYLDFNQVNAAGGITKAGTKAYLNTTQDNDRLRVRVRFGFDTDLGGGWSSGVRLATGSGGEIFVSTNQTLGTYGDAYQIALDQGWVRWTGSAFDDRQVITATGGRFGNPWVSTNMEWYNDLTFEGVMGNYKFNLSDDNQSRDDLFLTAGAFPLQSISTAVQSSSASKWLMGAQFGTDLHFDDDLHLQAAIAYYDYIHTFGQRNQPGSTALNYTAPLLVQKGNTMYDISNSTDPSVNLFALAADYRIVDLILVGEWRAFDHYAFTLTANAIKNVGYSASAIKARTGVYVAPRTQGYEADVGFGTAAFGPLNTWRASVGYRYLERDAVLDAFNDEDFHLGGTDTKGYQFVVDYSINPHVFTRVKYMSANAIDGPPLAIDVLQLDLVSQF
ncbi:MAG: putative porin [Proteobacteria bacterium]|nr:putative porin [Pseudomonadota bacterium]